MRFSLSLASTIVVVLAGFSQAAPIMISRRNPAPDMDVNSTRRNFAREYDVAPPYYRRVNGDSPAPVPLYKRVHARDFGRGPKVF
ncbi:hypothetical protein D9758_012279 [Tetrapyrgos nigripes]|uniref:Uncharacterized protein n=1 Tax=Tetrapyrgos nigripes TaxID=182062 RepID=A0A8H5FM53_9AGAR|nr:hypothetical protein D9758_012279 [Tetrapyrgos nigripes]